MSDLVTVAIITGVFGLLGTLLNARINRHRKLIADLQRQLDEVLSEKEELHTLNNDLRAESRAWRKWASRVMAILRALPKGEEIVVTLPPRPHTLVKR